MRAQGNQIKREEVIFALLIALLLPLLFLFFGRDEHDSSDMDSYMRYATSAPLNGSENNIGQQMPASKARQNRELDQRMYQFFELLKVE